MMRPFLSSPSPPAVCATPSPTAPQPPQPAASLQERTRGQGRLGMAACMMCMVGGRGRTAVWGKPSYSSNWGGKARARNQATGHGTMSFSHAIAAHAAACPSSHSLPTAHKRMEARGSLLGDHHDHGKIQQRRSFRHASPWPSQEATMQSNWRNASRRPRTISYLCFLRLLARGDGDGRQSNRWL